MTPNRARIVRTAGLLLVLGSVAAGAGCYKRVVSSKGFGATAQPVYEGNTSAGPGKTRTAHERKISH